MVFFKVEVKIFFYQEGVQGVIWICEGNLEYIFEENDKDFCGIDVILYINDEDKEFLENYCIQQLFDKYCKFLLVEIKFGIWIEIVIEGEGDDVEEKQVEVDNIINNFSLAWCKQFVDLMDEDYKVFYNEFYLFSILLMFWIYLNIDYFFNLIGILYFFKLGNNFEVQKNKIQLYSNQVYVIDDVKDIVLEFLMMLYGVIDLLDIFFNVLCSYLQSDLNVKKIIGYIIKKVVDKLVDFYKKEWDNFISKWDDFGVFIKYGMIFDEKFYDCVFFFMLVKSLDGIFMLIDEYKEKVKEQQIDKYDKIVMFYIYVLDQYNIFMEVVKNKGYDVLIFDNVIDNYFMQYLE